MKKISHAETLQEAIRLLKLQQAGQLDQLKEQYYYTYDSFKPTNLIKKAYNTMSSSTELRGNIISNLIGLGTGYITKNILIGSTHSPVKRILGTILQFVVTNVVAKKTEKKIESELDKS